MRRRQGTKKGKKRMGRRISSRSRCYTRFNKNLKRNRESW